MTTTVSSTRCWKSALFSLPLACALALVLAAASHAQAPAPAGAEITEFDVERDEGALLLSATVRFELTSQVEDALLKGIPMFFVAEAEVLRDRWYWTDLKVASESRHMRLAYQPLTRRWRLNVGPRPLGTSGVGVTLAQNFDALAEALSAIQRFSRWRIAAAADVDPDARHTVRFRFALDVSQLPRPFQIGAVGQPDWDIAASRTLRLPAEGAR